MARVPTAKVITLALALSGCGIVSVDMTSTPDTVRSGEPVTFDIKLTNQSPCPLRITAAELIPFISVQEINAQLSRVPPDVPPEVVAFIEELRAFLDDLCTGGTPMVPTPPFGQQPAARAAGFMNGLSRGCRRIKDEIVCQISGRVREPGNGMTFTLFDDRVHCVVDDSIVRCELRIPIPPASASPASAALGGAGLATQTLTCLTAAQIEDRFGGSFDEAGELGAICFIGDPPMIAGLGPNEMATGQVVLPARGAGFMRNFIFAGSGDPEDAGVCKGGSDAGEPCDRSDPECSGGTCGEGICVLGGNAGLGCNVATQMMDCPGGTCQVCNVPFPANALPVDCTTTYVSPEGAPTMSTWGLFGLAAIMLAAGTLWLQRRQRRG
jgi:hypothetical protein